MCNEISSSPLKAAEGKPQKRGSVRAGCFGAVFAGKNKHARTHARARSYPSSRRARLSLAHHRLHALRALFIRRVESFFLPSVCFGEKKRERGRRRKMEHLSTATVNAIVKQIKDLQKNPAEGITVRLVFFSVRVKCARERERERERDERRQLLLGIPLSLSLSHSLLLLLLLPLSSFSSSSSSSSFSNATLAFYSPKFTINKRN